MQHRYKINTSCEGRKSSSNATHSQKNDTLVFINLLDKCTRTLLDYTQKYYAKTESGLEINSKVMTSKS